MEVSWSSTSYDTIILRTCFLLVCVVVRPENLRSRDVGARRRLHVCRNGDFELKKHPAAAATVPCVRTLIFISKPGWFMAARKVYVCACVPLCAVTPRKRKALTTLTAQRNGKLWPSAGCTTYVPSHLKSEYLRVFLLSVLQSVHPTGTTMLSFWVMTDRCTSMYVRRRSIKISLLCQKMAVISAPQKMKLGKNRLAFPVPSALRNDNEIARPVGGKKKRVCQPVQICTQEQSIIDTEFVTAKIAKIKTTFRKPHTSFHFISSSCMLCRSAPLSLDAGPRVGVDSVVDGPHTHAAHVYRYLFRKVRT